MLLNACHPGKSSLSSVGGGGHTDFFKKKISNKSKICTHSEFTLLLGGGGGTYLQSLGFLCFQRDGMHFRLLYFRNHPALG